MPLRRCLVLAGCLLALSACKPEAAAPADGISADAAKPKVQETTATAVKAALPADNLGEFKIVSVLLGSTVDADNIVLAQSDTFASRSSIYATVLSVGAHQGLQISAKWLAPGGVVIAEKNQALVPTSATATTFKISNPDAWPVGEYEVQIAVNGRTLQSRKFEVR